MQLQQIKDQLLEDLKSGAPFVLASPEDAAFFRAAFVKKPAPVALPPAPEPIFAPAPPPPPAPKPVVIAAPVKKEATAPIEKPVFNLSSVRNVLSVVAPELAILQEIPSDAIAKKISERWKTKNQSAPISILSFQEPPEQKKLLGEIVKALDVYFGGARLVEAETIEKDKQWEAFLSVEGLKMIIVCDYTLWQLGALMQFYKETPAQGVRMLKDTPIFLLPDLSLYLKDPLLKRSLWKALCQKFS